MFPRLRPLTIILLGFITAVCILPAARGEFLLSRLLTEDPMGLSTRVPEARAALAQGAVVMDVPSAKTFAVVWFPPDYASQPVHRTMFVLHGSNGNAYQGIAHQLSKARKYKYGLVSLQWWRGGDQYLEPRDIHRAFSELMPTLVSRYGVSPRHAGLETFSRSASISYEIAYWDKVSQQNLYQLIIAQSGGVPIHNPRPLMATLSTEIDAPAKPPAAKPVPGKPVPPPPKPLHSPGKALEGKRFFLYCGRRDQEWGEAMCEGMRNARRIIEGQKGTVVQFIDDPEGGHGGMHNTPVHFEAATRAFLTATAGT